jgi:hypothetical protein
MIRGYARLGFLAVAWLLVVCLVVQVFLAGLGVFQNASNFATHREFAYLFGWLSVVMLVLALVGRMPRSYAGWSVALFLLMGLQSVFVLLRQSAPALAALHPVNGFLILFIAIAVARRARSYASWPVEAAVEPPPSEPGPG